jgi:hypothetical protein
LSHGWRDEISTFYPQPAGAFLIPLYAADTGSFHSRCGEFSTIYPQAFPVVIHGLCTHSPASRGPERDASGGDLVKIRFTLPLRTPAIYRAPRWFPPTGPMEPHIKLPRLTTGHAENSENNRGNSTMKKITAVVALMCALSAYVSYPSATGSGGATPSLALSMQESRSLSIEASDAV